MEKWSVNPHECLLLVVGQDVPQRPTRPTWEEIMTEQELLTWTANNVEVKTMASIFINSLYMLGSIMALGLGVIIVKAVIDTLRKK